MRLGRTPRARPGRVLEQPVGRVLPRAGKARAKARGRSVGTVVGRVLGRTQAAMVLERLEVTRATVRLGRTRVGTVLVRLVGARVTVHTRLGRIRLVRMAVALEVMGGLGLLGLWFWWWSRWLLLG